MKKTTGVVVGLAAAGPLLLAVPLLGITAGSAASSCSTGGTQTVDTAAVAAQVKTILDGSGADTVTVAGLDDPAEQVPNAKTIAATGLAMDIPARGQVVALATALQESGLRNLTYGDRDSLGLFQQRPSEGWGTAKRRRVTSAATAAPSTRPRGRTAVRGRTWPTSWSGCCPPRASDTGTPGRRLGAGWRPPLLAVVLPLWARTTPDVEGPTDGGGRTAPPSPGGRCSPVPRRRRQSHDHPRSARGRGGRFGEGSLSRRRATLGGE
jgi:hypothetical protein